MNITEARIDHLSDLARLSLPGGEKEEIARSAEGAVSSGRRTFFSGKTWLSGSAPAVSRPSSTAM